MYLKFKSRCINSTGVNSTLVIVKINTKKIMYLNIVGLLLLLKIQYRKPPHQIVRNIIELENRK